jgi:hypothetical protein
LAKFTVKPVLEKHYTKDNDSNIQAVKDSEIFFIFGDKGYINGIKDPNSDTLALVMLATFFEKPFILCLDNTLPLKDQIFLRGLCPKKTQVFSFNPQHYTGMELHNKMLNILEQAINKEIIKDPFLK